MTDIKKSKAPARKPAALMPGGKYKNLPVKACEDLYVLLWNINPNNINKLTSDQAQAIFKQSAKLLKASAWQMPDQVKEKPKGKKK